MVIAVETGLKNLDLMGTTLCLENQGRKRAEEG